MSKYIIDIPKTVGMLEAVGSVHYTYFDGIQCQTIILKGDEIEELTADYINEHYSSLQDEAYQRGLDDAWEAAKKIFGFVRAGGIPLDEIGKIFGYAEDEDFCTADIIRHNTASEAIAKLKAYEEKQKADDEIKVGDEVEPFYTYITGVVTLINGDIIYILWRDGSSISAMKLKEVTKTGRHFNIASILEEMRND